LRSAMLAFLLLSTVVGALDFDLSVSVGPTYASGGWGDNLSTGVWGRLDFRWMITPSVRAGAGMEASAFGSRYDTDASLTIMSPHLSVAYYLRPGAAVFNPGIEAAGGFARSSLGSGGGTDPATWDPFWRAGVRWDFSIGAGFRGAVGCDYTGIMAEGKSGDMFGLVFAVSREVSL
jgi:hypothetical protein